MVRKTFVTLALLLMLDTAAAVRVIEQVEDAVELALVDLALPTASGGTISFKACETCAFSTHRLMDSTEFRINGQAVPFIEFLRLADEIKATQSAGRAVATVFLDIATGRISRIEVRA